MVPTDSSANNPKAISQLRQSNVAITFTLWFLRSHSDLGTSLGPASSQLPSDQQDPEQLDAKSMLATLWTTVGPLDSCGPIQSKLAISLVYDFRGGRMETIPG
ncbi:hypothetical protein AAES_01759 [Amazona aestiva]|uniref:Uncharacterized protein n=1 Tax=Amazona aestiva TaxID=12930 RepID=A0A0Q3U4W5_AMAAE|nr:hypothetical protein AAES_01759 [Amazona aestiva]